MIEDIWYVKGINIFEKITDYEDKLLERRAKLKKYKRYDLVCDKSSNLSIIYVIKKGSVRIYKPHSEKDKTTKSNQTNSNSSLQEKSEPKESAENDLFSQFTTDTSESDTDKEVKSLPVILKSGDFFGIISGQNQVSDFVIESMDDSEIYLTRRSTIELLFKYNNEPSITIEKFAGLHKHKLQNRIQNLINQDIVSRLAFLLLNFSEKYSTWDGSKAVMDFRLSTKELSKLVGATNEDIDQVLKWLKREKIISIKRKKIKVLDGWELKRIVDKRRSVKAKHTHYVKFTRKTNDIGKIQRHILY